MGIILRPVEQRDNRVLAELIRSVFREFKIDQPGTVYTDPTTDNLFELFTTPKSAYWVADEEGIISGGCGIYPTKGLPENCAELVKFYVAAQSRGRGLGKKLLEKSFSAAAEFGYKELYLESFPQLAQAVGMYKKAGFTDIGHSLGNSGHYACNIWMIKSL